MGSFISEIKDWHGERKCLAVVKALNSRGFDAEFFNDDESAACRVVELCKDAASIGFGGSMTIAGMGLSGRLSGRGAELIDHSAKGLSAGEKMEAMRRQQTCSVFLCSANAIASDGTVVNIDGNGNRVAASIFGPGKVVMVAGRNKIVSGGAAEAIARAKSESCPVNAHRLGRDVPCAETGVCADCNSPERICRVTVIFDRRPSLTEFHILIVNKDLGL